MKYNHNNCNNCVHHRTYFDDGWDYMKKSYCNRRHSLDNKNNSETFCKDWSDKQTIGDDILEWLEECWFPLLGVFAIVILALIS